VEQALLLRGSRDFGGLAEYAQLLKDLFTQRNAGRRARLAEELAVMRELPARRMESAKRERVRVDSGSLIHVERNAYSVNSRLIGARVEARLYLDHVEVWHGQRKVADLPRLAYLLRPGLLGDVVQDQIPELEVIVDGIKFELAILKADSPGPPLRAASRASRSV